MRTKPLPLGCGEKVRCIGSGLRVNDQLVTRRNDYYPEYAENAICWRCGREVLLFTGNRYRRHLRPADGVMP